MNRERLEHLITVIRRVPDEQFDLSLWMSSDYNIQEQKALDPECKTVGCALGWACLDPEFKAQGLHLNKFNEPTFGRDTSFSAGEVFFDIGYIASSFLFSPTQYPGHEYSRDITKQDVISHIEHVLAGKPIPNLHNPGEPFNDY